MHIRGLVAGLLVGTGLWCATVANAHEIRPAVATASFTPTQVRLEIGVNLEAAMAGIAPAHRDTSESPNAQTYNELRALAPAVLRARFREFAPRYLEAVRIELDGRAVALRLDSLEVPAIGDPKSARISLLRLSGEIPPGTRELRIAYDAALGTAVVRFPGQGGAPVAVWLKDGRKSEAYVLGQGLREPARAEVIGQYVVHGFTHILPLGVDHILFVLGLFLLSLKWRPLLIQVTAFTVAHTITLGLAVYGVVKLPPTIVEPLIAASIVYVAVENILTPRLHVWRPFVVFAFGLLHGLGFAGVLEEIGLPSSGLITALLSFNVGVELGQLAVIAIAWLAVGLWFRNRPWYRQRVIIPASALIALVGLYWTVERVFL